MKIKILDGLLIVDILTILLILFIILIPVSTIRIILGIPFLLFFPGYALVEMLFAGSEGMNVIKRVAMSFGMSIALVALIGFGLNYTSWGIRLEPILYSISAFTILMSAIAMVRRVKLNKQFKFTGDFYLKIPGWEGSGFNKVLTIILIIAIVGSIGSLGYSVAVPKTGEKFTEFYILGHESKAQDYPSEFTMLGNQVTGVSYGDSYHESAGYGKVTVGIVNHEQEKTIYTLKVFIDGEQVDLIYNEQSLKQVEGIVLGPEEKWEKEIGFAPQHPGENQKVEFLLYKDGAAEPSLNLHMWVNVRE